IDRWPSDRPAISALALCRSGDLEIFGERDSDAQCRAKLALSGCGGEHRACHVERRPHFDQACRLSAGQREKPGLGCGAGKEISTFGGTRPGARSLRENFAARLGAGGGGRRASSDEIAEDALTGRSKRCLDFARYDKGNEGGAI